VKAVILAGGLGTRLSEETGVRPKPMVEIGEQPVLWHVLKIFSTYGVNDFIICCGYKGHIIKEYFRDYTLRTSSTTFDMRLGRTTFHESTAEPWRVTVAETGADSMTGGRIRRVRNFIGNEPFFLTYGDGVSDVDIRALYAFHKAHGRHATVTAVQPPGRFGVFSVADEDPLVRSFTEKPRGDGSWINGGFFVLEPEIFDYIDGDDNVWEQAPMRRLASEGQLVAYRHDGFWHAMDTLRDKAVLADLWARNAAPWKVWGDNEVIQLSRAI